MGIIVANRHATMLLGVHGNRSIAINSSGKLYAVWGDSPDAYTQKSIKIKESTDGGDTWIGEETIDSPGGDHTGCACPTIAIDSYDTIYVSYLKQITSYTRKIRVAKKVLLGSWVLYDATTASSWAQPAVAVDSDDNIHVGMAKQMDHYKDFYYIVSTNGGSSWSTPIKINGLDAEWAFGLAVGPDGYPHMAWLEHDNGSLYHSYKDSGGWHTELVASGQGGDNWIYYWDTVSIAIDTDGYVNLVTVRENGIGGTGWTESSTYFNNRTGSWVQKTIYTEPLNWATFGHMGISISQDGSIFIYFPRMFCGLWLYKSINNGLSFTGGQVLSSGLTDGYTSMLWAYWPSTARLASGYIGVYGKWVSGTSNANFYSIRKEHMPGGYAFVT